MSGFFGVASHEPCIMDVFFGVDYHSHLGTRRGGIATYDEDGFHRGIHNIENSQFRSKFDRDLDEFTGNLGIGCISDSEPQPILVKSHLGSYAVVTVGKINNEKELIDYCFENGQTHFLEMSGHNVNATELIAALINQKDSIVEGIKFVQESVKGSMSLLVMTSEGIYCARDKLGRTPVIIGGKDGAHCATFETTAFMNLGYQHVKDLGPGEICLITADEVKDLVPANDKMRMCTFLWIYYGYPTSSYEGVNVEAMRYECGKMLAGRDNVHPDSVAGVPDSGTAHAVGYANASGIPFERPFIKYTPTWPRSFMPTKQSQRNLIAKMKLLPVEELIKDKSLLIIDDSIVRGTQLRETTEYLFNSGAKEVHVRPACPPLVFGCKYLNFSRSNSEMDLITRRVIADFEGEENPSFEVLQHYCDPDDPKYQKMLDEICRRLKFTSLRYHRLDDMLESVGIGADKLCTYCWDGKE